MNKFLSILTLAVFSMFSMNIAMASDWYVTGQVTRTQADATASVDLGGISVGAMVDLDATTGAGVGVGYNVTNWFAVEATYDDLGSASTLGINHDANSTAFWLVVDPTLTTISGMPLKLTARAGVANTELNGAGGSLSDTGFAYGLGFALEVMPAIDVTLGYIHRDIDESLTVFGTPVNVDVNFDTAALGVKYTF